MSDETMVTGELDSANDDICKRIRDFHWLTDGVAPVGTIIKADGCFRKVIGYAIGSDGQACYATSAESGEGKWKTYLVPVAKVKAYYAECEL